MTHKAAGALLLLPAALIGGHGLLYLLGAFFMGLVGLGFGGLSLAAVLHQGTSQDLVGIGVLGIFATIGIGFLVLAAVVHLVLGGITLYLSIRGLLGRAGRASLVVASVLAAAFCASWTMMALAAFNPLVVVWFAAAAMAGVAGLGLVLAPIPPR